MGRDCLPTPGPGTGLAGPPGALQGSVPPCPDADTISSGAGLRQSGHPEPHLALYGPLFTRILLDSRNEGLQPESRIGLGLARRHRSRVAGRKRRAPAASPLPPSFSGGKPGAQVAVCPDLAKRRHILGCPLPASPTSSPSHPRLDRQWVKPS